MKKTNYVLFLAALMAVATALGGCKKEEPLPKTNSKPTNKNITKTPMAPNDSSLLVPMDPGEPATMLMADQRATITWNWYNWIMYNDFINPDTIEYHANRHNIDRITLMPDTNSFQSNVITCYYTPYDFHRAFDTICKYWDILEQHGKIVDAGNAIIYVNKYNGAQWPNNGYEPYAMSLEDSIRYTDKGCRVMRGYFNYKSGDTNTQHEYKSRMDSVHPALYKKQMQRFDTTRTTMNRQRHNVRQPQGR